MRRRINSRRVILGILEENITTQETIFSKGLSLVEHLKKYAGTTQLVECTMIGDGTSIPTKLEGTIKEVQGNNVYGGCVVISTDSIDYQIPFIGISSAIETITLAEIGEKIYIAPDNITEAYKSTNILKKKRKRWHV